MPDIDIAFSDAELEFLEQIREQHGLPSIEEVALWLLKTEVREGVKRATGSKRIIRAVEEVSDL
ncbi:MAG: hypothetical protein P4M06_14315 [Pandoraea sp.]|nr:hypothetical protein [Pandoraea sp.]MDR3398719.1 hypothetical protein [Pandoraea sp.]